MRHRLGLATILVVGGCTALQPSASDNEPGGDDSGPVARGADPVSAAVPTPRSAAAACEGLDHASHYVAIAKACAGTGRFDVDQECVDAVRSSYPIGVDLITPPEVISLCAAEREYCGPGDERACGEAFCQCTAGLGPFDWDNCWQLTSLACSHLQQSDCNDALARCYPGSTREQLAPCLETVRSTDAIPGSDCDCPKCGAHERCEAALNECMVQRHGATDVRSFGPRWDR